jgi:phage tail-like protein
MATIVNNRSSLLTDPLRNFRFLVTFKQQTGASTATKALAESTAVMGFTSVSGMAVTTDSIPYREGGYNTTVHQIPGQTTFAPITLQRGMILGTAKDWGWMREMFATVQGGTGSRGVADNFRCDLEIEVLSHPIPGVGTEGSGDNTPPKDHVAMRFRVYNCWPTSIAYSDLNAGDNALFVEQMTLVHEGFDVNFATKLDASAPTEFGAAGTAVNNGGGGQSAVVSS